MSKRCRRLILKPPGLDPHAADRLAKLLALAAQRQNRLADASPHVLRFTSTLSQDETSFYFEHEEASPIDVAPLFDPAAPPSPESDVYALTAALLDALRVAHGDEPGGMIHGGICPGVCLRGDDGLWKLTDFGFAPAICEALGIDPYLNLAIGPPADPAAGAAASAAWECLADSDESRDDRLCAFIDPEKYHRAQVEGDTRLAAFERGSDLFAAGIVCTLLMDRVHPYFKGARTAHRNLWECRFAMPGNLPSRSRRFPAPDAAPPAFRTWDACVQKMIDRRAASRPGIEVLVREFAPAAPPIDAAAILRAREERAAAAWADGLAPLLKDARWDDIDKYLQSKPALQAWPPDALQREEQARTALAKVRAEQAAEKKRAEEVARARKWVEQFRRAVEAGDLAAADQLAAGRPAAVPSDAAKLLPRLDQAHRVLRKRADDAENARHWILTAKHAFDAGRADEAERLLERRPELEHWPPDALNDEKSLRDRLQRERQSIEADHSAARDWLTAARQAHDRGGWKAALDVLNAPPSLRHWPPNLYEDARRFKEQCIEQGSDDVGRELARRRDLVRQAVGRLVDGLVAGALDGCLARDALMVDCDIVPSGPSLDAGRAMVRIAISHAKGPAPGPIVAESLDYQIDAAGAVALEGQAFTSAAGPPLAAAVLALQQAALKSWADDTAAGYFPALRLAGAPRKPVAAMTVALHLVPDAAAKVPPVQAELRWDPAALAWRCADDAKLAGALRAMLFNRAQTDLQTAYAAAGGLLKAYSSHLSLEVDPPAAAPRLSRPLKFTARVVARGPLAAAGGRPLHAFEGECRPAGAPQPAPNLAPAQDALAARILDLQRAAHQALLDQFTQRLAPAGRKARVVLTPKQIKTPVDEIACDLRAARGKTLECTVPWSVERVRFEPPADLDARLDALLAPPAAASEAKAPSSKKPRPPGKPRRGLVQGAVGLVAAAVVVGGIAYAIRNRGGSGNGGPPPQPPPPPAAIAVSITLNDVLARDSRLLTDLATALTADAAASRVDVPVSDDAWTPAGDGAFTAPATARFANPPVVVPISVRADWKTFAHAWTTSVTLPLDRRGDVVEALCAAAHARCEVMKTAVDPSERDRLCNALTALRAATDDDPSLRPVTCAWPEPRDCGCPAETTPVEHPTTTTAPETVPVSQTSQPTTDTQPTTRIVQLPCDHPAGQRTIDVLLIAGPAFAKSRDEINSIADPRVEGQPRMFPDTHTVVLGTWKPDETSPGQFIQFISLPLLPPRGAIVTLTCTHSCGDGSEFMRDSVDLTLPENELAIQQYFETLRQAAETAILRLAAAAQLDDARKACEEVNAALARLKPLGIEIPPIPAPKPPPATDWAGFVHKGRYRPLGDPAGHDACPDCPSRIEYTLDAADGGARAMRLVIVVQEDIDKWRIATDALQNDPRWIALALPAKAPLIFYVDEQEWPAAPPDPQPATQLPSPQAPLVQRVGHDFNAAREWAGRASDGRRIPTRSEWCFAALKFHDQHPAVMNLFAGRWEWCAPDVGDDASPLPWLCGGSQVLVDQRALFPVDKSPLGKLLNSEPAKLDHADILTALSDPLVCQRRAPDFGDGLAGVRTILPIEHPR